MEDDRKPAKTDGGVGTATAAPPESSERPERADKAEKAAPPERGDKGDKGPASQGPAQTISLSAMKEMSNAALTKIAKELEIAGATGMR